MSYHKAYTWNEAVELEHTYHNGQVSQRMIRKNKSNRRAAI